MWVGHAESDWWHGKRDVTQRLRRMTVAHAWTSEVFPLYTFGESDLFWTATSGLNFRLWLNKPQPQGWEAREGTIQDLV